MGRSGGASKTRHGTASICFRSRSTIGLAKANVVGGRIPSFERRAYCRGVMRGLKQARLLLGSRNCSAGLQQCREGPGEKTIFAGPFLREPGRKLAAIPTTAARPRIDVSPVCLGRAGLRREAC